MRVIFDTGSTNAWFLNKDLDCQRLEGRTGFEDAKSKTLRKPDKEFIKVGFGSGKLGGHFYQDEVRIGSGKD